ncbi:DNA polymerase III subunit delta' [Millisia brevis]|uniref:DNA polymerase III subunit delta' n=1 Tax=Millisia brevis TaxID=264148 RepID=UPI000832B4E5|nr:DNA polymerase III subunit delta' [Millisia brevis]
MGSVFDRLVGQDEVVAGLTDAAVAARLDDPGSRMTQSWLFTGPPGSGRSNAAVAFAAALQCTDPGMPGCGHCHSCSTVLAGTHADVRRVIPEGLSIGVKEMRELVSVASRRPGVGRYQVVIVEDADRLTEGAGNVLLKIVEEPPARTVFLLCAPSVDPEDISVTLRSRCRHVALTTPSVDAIARVLIEADGFDPEQARIAAGISGGHVGRARRLARDEQAREHRNRALDLASAALQPARAYAAAEALAAAADLEARQVGEQRDERELEELRTALGAGGTGKGTAGTLRGAMSVIRDLERRQKSRATRTGRDTLDRALIDLAGMFRDALAVSMRASVAATHPDRDRQARELAQQLSSTQLLRSLEAVLACRSALDMNVKPRFALAAMVAEITAAAAAR